MRTLETYSTLYTTLIQKRSEMMSRCLLVTDTELEAFGLELQAAKTMRDELSNQGKAMRVALLRAEIEAQKATMPIR